MATATITSVNPERSVVFNGRIYLPALAGLKPSSLPLSGMCMGRKLPLPAMAITLRVRLGEGEPDIAIFPFDRL